MVAGILVVHCARIGCTHTQTQTHKHPSRSNVTENQTMPCMLSIAWELRLTKWVILLVRNGRLLSCKATADILSRICGGRFKFTLADNQLKVKNTKLPMDGISKIIPIQTWGCPCLELEKKKPKKKAKKSTKTVPRRHCLLWFYYFSILHLFQTNLVRCRCINLLSFFFFSSLVIL